jgi:hypothetical protein
LGLVNVAGRRAERASGTLRTVAVALLLLAPLTAAAGCASAPRPTPDINPPDISTAAAATPLDERITLPTTMGLAFNHPRPATRVEHQILYTIQQSFRAQLHAEYGSGATDPLLPVYWSGSALAAIKRDVTNWTKEHQQPVGVLVVSNTTYSPPNAGGKATVSYCVNWRHVVRGNATTHVVGPSVQKPGTPGTYTTLTLTRSSQARWQVSGMQQVLRSPRCPASK